MATILHTDPERGAGFARICFDVGASPLPSMPEGCAFTLQRASDALFLAHSGWQESQTELPPDALVRQDNTLELCVGPYVVDNLDILNTYRIHLRHTTLPPSVIHIESLEYSPLKGKEGLHIAAAASPTIAPPPPVEEPLPSVTEAPMAEAPMAEAPTEELPLAPPLAMATDSTPQVTGNKKVFGIVALVVLIAAAGAGWYWLQQRAETPVAQQTPAAPSVAPAPSPAAPALSPLAQARQLLLDNSDAAKSLALARQLQGQLSTDAPSTDPAAANQHADAIFLLVEDAAQKGQGEAMILLARYFDPVDKAPKGSIHSDPQQALHWYTQARATGQGPAADNGISALRQWATTAAAAGNKAAQEVLRTP